MSSVNQSCWSITARLVPQPVAVVAQGSDAGAVWLGKSSKSATAVVPAKASVMFAGGVVELLQDLLHAEQAGVQADLLEPVVDERAALRGVALVDAWVS